MLRFRAGGTTVDHWALGWRITGGVYAHLSLLENAHFCLKMLDEEVL